MIARRPRCECLTLAVVYEVSVFAMKKQKANQSGRAILKQLQNTKLPVRKKRAIHVHIALHPMSILALLCMGVLLVSFTMNALADSYTVTAIIPAPPLASPATVTSLPNNVETGSQTIAVTGACPANSYVDLLDNGRFTGEAMCTSGAFRIGLVLVPGVNRLQVQDYNITNDPGPTSGIITITYVPGGSQLSGASTETTPVYSLSQLVVTQVDDNVPYKPTGTLTVDSKPTISGVAPPHSRVFVAISSRPYTCTTTADTLGYWSCSIAGLPAGEHTVDITATTPEGVQLIFPPFKIVVSAMPSAAASAIPPLFLSSSYSYSVHNVGQIVTYAVSIVGGHLPYAFVVNWGDGTTELSLRENAGTFNLSHTYGWVNAPRTTKRVQVQAVSADGQSALLQLDTILRNPAYSGAIANITRSSGLWGVFDALRPWLWLLWPGYLIIVLLVISFWLGEHEELLLIRKRRRLAAMKGKRRQAHVHR